MSDAIDLKVAARLAPLVSPERVRQAREYHGWTQTDLAGRMKPSVSAPALSQLERGQTKPSGPTLLAIAAATDFPLQYFVKRSGEPDAAGFFRSMRSTPARERKRALARAHLLHDLVLALDRYIEIPEPDYPRYEPTSHDQDEIENIADRVRRDWGLGSGPLKNVVRTMERRGIVVARLPIETKKVDAFSVCFSDWPVVILGSDKLVTARSRFDAAHELGHLVMHDSDQVGHKDAETQAHQFAAAFLMPRRGIESELAHAGDWRDFLDLKARWGASLAALVRRARTVGAISDYEYTNTMKVMSARGWRRNEPGDELLGRPESPRLLIEAIRALEIGLDDLAEEFGLPMPAIRSLLAENEHRRRLEI